MRDLSDPALDADRELRLAKHRERIERFIATLDETSAIANREIVTIARSADSLPVLALIEAMPRLAQAGIRMRFVLGRLDPDNALADLVSALSALPATERASTLVRYLKHSRLHDAHEQMTLGDRFGWSGDSIRRAAGKRDAFELDAEGFSVHLGNFAFTALWSASAPMPSRARSRSSAVDAVAQAYTFAAASLFRPQSLRH